MSRPARPPAPRFLVMGSGWVLFLVLLAARAALLIALVPPSDDVNLYFKCATATGDKGLIPYREVPIEYPPLACGLMMVPWQIDRLGAGPPTSISAELPRQAARYELTFRILMAGADALAFLLFASTIVRRRSEYARTACWCCFICTTLFADLLFTRLDSGLSLVLLLWAYAWTQASQGGSPAWRRLAYFAVGLGVAYKLVPIVMAPALVLAGWGTCHRWTRWRSLLADVAAGTGGILLPLVPFLPAAGSDVFNWLQYHSARGVEVESVYASLMMLGTVCGLHPRAYFDYGSWNLTSEAASVLLGASHWLIAGALALPLAWTFCSRRLYDRDAAFRLACLAVLTTVTFSKVLSPQYLIWCLPLALLLAADVLNLREMRVFQILLVLIAALTTAVFPLLFCNERLPWHLVPELDPLPWCLIILRNSILLGIVLWLGVTTVRRLPRPTEPISNN